MARAENLARRARIDLNAEPPADALSRFGLTAREREVLDSIAEGLSNKAIAERLYLSHRTVGVHVSNVLRKLEVNSRGQAAAVVTRSNTDVASA
jgi:DNA-binding NarL/FixJ family response regulator